MAGTWLSFPAQIIRQSPHGPEIAVFTCDAYTLQDFSAVSRKKESPEGYQRLLNGRKIASIAKYVNVPMSVLPTSVILGADSDPQYLEIKGRKKLPGSAGRWSATIRVRAGAPKKPCLIIDGQHRVFGVAESARTEYPLPVCLLLDVDLVTQLLHFIIINNKGTRLSASHINELMGDIAKLTDDDKERLARLQDQLGVGSVSTPALISELNSEGMVFDGILDFPSNDTQLVSSASLKQVITASRRDGALSHIGDDDSLQLLVANNMWEGVKLHFSERWTFELELLKKALSDTKTKAAKKKAAKKKAAKKKGVRKKGKKKPAAKYTSMADFRRQKRLFHSGAIRVLGRVVDRELASVPNRREWQSGTSGVDQIPKIVAENILGAVPECFWDDVKIDNTTKGRKALLRQLNAALV